MEAKTRENPREQPKKDIEALLDGLLRALLAEQRPTVEPRVDVPSQAVQS